MALQLTSRDIPSVDVAHEIFGLETGLLVARPGRSMLTWWFTVPEGMYALVTRYGALVPFENGNLVWPPGMHYGPPWLRVSHLVTKQHVVFDAPVKGCITKDNVSVHIDTAVVFRICGDPLKGESSELVSKFVYNLTPRGLQTQLGNALEEAVRALARSMNHTEVYGLRNVRLPGSTVSFSPSAPVGADEVKGDELVPDENIQLQRMGSQEAAMFGQHDEKDKLHAVYSTFKGQGAAERMRRALNTQFFPQGVEIVDVMIEDVRLPDDIMKQMESKTKVISENAQQRMNQQYEMQQIRFTEELTTLHQTYEEQREREKVTGQQKVTEVRVRLNALKADLNKQVRLIEQESKVSLDTIEADTALEVTRLQQATAQVLAEIRNDSVSTAERLKAETSLYCTQTRAEAALEAARNEAKADEVKAAGEGTAAPMLEKKNEFLIAQKKMEIYRSLAGNSELVLSDSTNDEMNTMLLCDAILQSSAGGKTPTRSELLAEMMIMSKGSRIAMRHHDMTISTGIDT